MNDVITENTKKFIKDIAKNHIKNNYENYISNNDKCEYPKIDLEDFTDFIVRVCCNNIDNKNQEILNLTQIVLNLIDTYFQKK